MQQIHTGASSMVVLSRLRVLGNRLKGRPDTAGLAPPVDAARAELKLQIAEQKARDIYRDTEPKLELMFPGRKTLVDSFFHQEPRKKAKEE